MTGIRDWAEEGATPEELALLAASKHERPAAAARSRTLAALGVGAVLSAATSTTTAAATTIAGTTFKLIAKIALAVVVTGGASGLAWQAVRKPASVATPARPVVVAAPTQLKEPQVEAPPQIEAPVVAAPASAPDVPQAGVASRSVRSRPAPSASADTLSQQVAALEKAHAALAAHDPKAALRALDRYRAKFPDGTLSSEEKVLRVEAALAQGDKNRAATLANELRAANPDSPYARRVGDLVSQGKTPKPKP